MLKTNDIIKLNAAVKKLSYWGLERGGLTVWFSHSNHYCNTVLLLFRLLLGKAAH